MIALQRLFVYYRVPALDEAAVVSALRLLHGRWREATPGLHCDLLRRADEDAAGNVTLMETYTGATLDTLQRFEHEAAARTARWLAGARHVEVFTPCA